MLSHRFDDALGFAAATHRTQTRKGSGIPYIAHLMSVSALTLEYDGDEDCAIAALLHDAVEDQGGSAMAREIETRFGGNVTRIVLDCSDRTDDADTPWQVRKDSYLAGIASKTDDSLLVTSCDKLHNATTILYDLRQIGLSVFDRFNAGREGTIWYYRALSDALCQRFPGALTDRLATVVLQIEDACIAADAA